MARSNNWFEHALERTGWRPERQVVALAALGFAIALILGALYLSQVAREATTNRRLTVLLEERDELERINEQLRAEIAGLESVPALRARAQQLGFIDAERGNIEYLMVQDYVPQQIETVAEIEDTQDSDEIEGEQETFTDWLSRQWNNVRRSLGGDGGEE